MARKKTHVEFVKEVEIKGNGEYEVLTIYHGNDVKITLRHNVCGHEYEVVPYSFFNGRRCPKCRSLKKSPDEYRKEFDKNSNGEFKLLSEYVNARNKVKVKHLKCGLIFETSPNSFLKKSNCPKCYVYNRTYNKKKTTEEIIKEVKTLHNNEFRMVGGEYDGKDSVLKFKHLLCGTEFETRYHDFKNGASMCPKCGYEKLVNIHLKPKEQFIEEFNKVTRGEYVLLSDYKRTMKKIRLRHKVCGYEWECSPNNFMSKGSRCPLCNSSKGEQWVYKWLTFKNIDFKFQHKFQDCKYKRLLSFDFYIPNHNICIELDGEFHFKDKSGINDLEYQIKRDNIKDDYCRDKDIKLVRIPFSSNNTSHRWKFSYIEKLLENAFS